MPLSYKSLPVTLLSQNCTLLMCQDTKEAAVVDPGGKVDSILMLAKKMGATLKKIILTHAHIDHVAGVSELKVRTQLPIIGPHRDDQFWLDALPTQAKLFRMNSIETFIPDRWLNDGDTIDVGRVELQVIHTPGHTPGHVVFYSKEDELALVGDVIFRGAVGRTDFPRSNTEQLFDSIHDRLLPLGRQVRFISGHGPMSTFGDEIDGNPFIDQQRISS